jgi:hypothetical protein
MLRLSMLRLRPGRRSWPRFLSRFLSRCRRRFLLWSRTSRWSWPGFWCRSRRSCRPALWSRNLRSCCRCWLRSRFRPRFWSRTTYRLLCWPGLRPCLRSGPRVRCWSSLGPFCRRRTSYWLCSWLGSCRSCRPRVRRWSRLGSCLGSCSRSFCRRWTSCWFCSRFRSSRSSGPRVRCRSRLARSRHRSRLIGRSGFIDRPVIRSRPGCRRAYRTHTASRNCAVEVRRGSCRFLQGSIPRIAMIH